VTWLPLTSAQRGLWFAHEVAPHSPAYTTAEVVEFDRRIDAGRLRAALSAAYADFEQLRVRLRLVPQGPQQRVQPPSEARLDVLEFDDEPAAESWLLDQLSTPFDLHVDALTRSAVLHVGERSWWFHAAHHIVLDGHGYLQFARRVASRYRGEEPPRVEAALADVVAADDETDDDGFWDRRLATFHGTASLAGAVADPAPAATRATRDLDDDIADALRDAGRRLGTPWTTVAVAAMAGYLGRLVGTDRVRAGVPHMNRMIPGVGALAASRTVTTAMNVVPMQVPAHGLTVSALVATVGAELTEVGRRSRRRQEDLLRDLARLGDAQLFGPQLNLLPFDPMLDFGDARGRVRNLTAGPVEDMTWTMRGVPGRTPVRLEIDANPRLYSDDEVAAHTERIHRWIGVFASADSDAAVDLLPLLTDDERRRVLTDFNSTDHSIRPRTLGEAFAEQVGRTPRAPAVIHGGEALTYDELAARADAIAAALPGGGTVGVLLERGLDLYCAVHGVHRAAAAYVPLDPDLPDERLAEISEDAALCAVITTPALAERTPHHLPRILVDELKPAPDGFAPDFAGLDDPAYVLFTSGSTGRPKGVVVSHRAIDNRLAWMQSHLPIDESDRVLHKTPISFDVSVWELFWPLQVGAAVVVADPGGHREPRHIAKLIDEHRVTVAHFVPSMLRAFLGDDASAARASGRLRHLVCSGEALDVGLVRACGSGLGVAPVNLYGPTEAAVDVTCWDADPATDRAVVPIGRPVWNTRTYVLDRNRQPLPVGIRGELYLAGVQLADGYVGRPDLTDAAFVPDPFRSGARMYRTGDAARWRDDGALLYDGRVDDQVKIRGQRIEPGEIEHVLGDVAGVTAIAVVARPDRLGDAALVAFVVGDADDDALRVAARERLPEAMVPSRFVAVDSLPLTTSGKTDRGALRRLSLPDDDRAAAGIPADLLTERLCRAMTAILNAPVGADDDFFRAGGSSLSALRLLTEIERTTGVVLSFRDVFTASSPRELAAVVADGVSSGGDLDPVLMLRPGDPTRPPLFALPPAGGLGWCWAGLLRHLDPAQPVIALQADGMDGGPAPEPATLGAWAERMYERIREITRGTFHVIGWSVGGMLAHEIAALAESAGRPVGGVTLLDAYPTDQWRDLPEPTESETLRALLRMAGAEDRVAPDTVLDRAATMEILRASGSAIAALPDAAIEASMRAVLMSTRLVRTGVHRPLTCDVTLFVAGAPREEDWLDPLGWKAHLGGGLRIEVLEATHAELVREPAIGRVGAHLSAQFGS